MGFPLVAREADALWYDGLTLRRVGGDELNVWVVLGREGEAEPREALFV